MSKTQLLRLVMLGECWGSRLLMRWIQYDKVIINTGLQGSLQEDGLINWRAEEASWRTVRMFGGERKNILGQGTT